MPRRRASGATSTARTLPRVSSATAHSEPDEPAPDLGPERRGVVAPEQVRERVRRQVVRRAGRPQGVGGGEVVGAERAQGHAAAGASFFLPNVGSMRSRAVTRKLGIVAISTQVKNDG